MQLHHERKRKRRKRARALTDEFPFTPKQMIVASVVIVLLLLMRAITLGVSPVFSKNF
jgi:hypothetical protein